MFDVQLCLTDNNCMSCLKEKCWFYCNSFDILKPHVSTGTYFQHNRMFVVESANESTRGDLTSYSIYYLYSMYQSTKPSTLRISRDP